MFRPQGPTRSVASCLFAVSKSWPSPQVQLHARTTYYRRTEF